MKHALPLLFVACLACSNHEAGAPDESAAQLDADTARAFLERVGDEPVRLLGGDLGSEAEIETYNWILRSVARTNGVEFTGFIARRLNPLSQDSYALRLHRSKGYPELVAGKRYVEVHFLHAASGPEIHGIIDVDQMKVVSIIEDGGA